VTIKPRLILIAIALAFISSCSLFSSRNNKKHYYQIYYKAKKREGKPIRETVRVKKFEVDNIYKRFNLVYRKSAYELFFYRTHLWASRPSEMISDVLANHIREAELFSDVIVKLDRKPRYVITGRVEALDKIDSKDRWFARVAISMVVKEFDTGLEIVSHSFDRRKEVFNSSQAHIVRAFGEIIEEETEAFFDKIDATLIQN
jgi:uncharacterized lipoprotein YmbA